MNDTGGGEPYAYFHGTKALLASYFGQGSSPMAAPSWSSTRRTESVAMSGAIAASWPI